jgi:hypothetical protein
MSYVNDGSVAFRVDTSETRYPLNSTPDGTTTAGSSDYLGAGGIVIESIVNLLGVANTVTLSDHAGTTTTDLVVSMPAILGAVVSFGPNGIRVPWRGIRAVAGATANAAHLVIFRCA